MISVRSMYLRNIWWNFRHRRYNLFSISEGDYISTINDEMLKYAIDNGILNPELIFAQVEMKKRNRYIEQHNHKIWYNEKRKQWYTYLDDNSKRGYSLKHRSSKKEIENLVVDFYKKQENEPYFDKVVEMWLEQKLSYGEISPQTYNRYANDFKRFYTPNCIVYQMRIKDIDENILEAYIKTTIKQFNLTAKSYAGFRTIIRGTFKYAKRKNLTDLSISTFFGDLDLARNSFKKRIVNKEDEVFSEDEVKLITGYLRNKRDIRSLGVLLAFETGMRVGELSGLKKEDISKNIIHIQRTEITYKDPKTQNRICEVRDYPKSDAGDRYLIIPEGALDTIDEIIKINPNGKYLFSDEGKRVRSNAFNRKLDRICEELKIPLRSMHKIRKTYGTTLIDQNVDESLVAEQMGHKDISTTKKYYYFSNKGNKAKTEQINRALSC